MDKSGEMDEEAVILNPAFDESEEYHEAREDTEIQKDSNKDLDKDQSSRKGLVKNGICIQCEGKKWYFDYDISTKSMDLYDDHINSWEVISTTEKSGLPHFRCLWISDPDGPSLIQSVSETLATVVIIINNIESFQIEDWVYEICSLPVVVLCSSAGHILRRVFDKRLETVAKISLSPMEVEEIMICETNPDEHRKPADQTSKKSSKSLYSRVSGYLSESMTSVPTKVSDDPTVFAMIMSEFRVYEHHKQGRDANEIKKVLDLLNKRINQVFGRDFPFYFCVAGRMMCVKGVYSGGHFEKFCTMCTEYFELLECEVLANTLINFISSYSLIPIKPRLET